ncbi:hypothetical protein CL618_03185 [archaeon]|nr:hypothetical protein [archaeon]|tara:strand:+ start:4172 stop:4543 length:372 start_codon:yes stop_codon:yes gene_type:complete
MKENDLKIGLIFIILIILLSFTQISFAINNEQTECEKKSGYLIFWNEECKESFYDAGSGILGASKSHTCCLPIEEEIEIIESSNKTIEVEPQSLIQEEVIEKERIISTNVVEKIINWFKSLFS